MASPYLEEIRTQLKETEALEAIAAAFVRQTRLGIISFYLIEP